MPHQQPMSSGNLQFTNMETNQKQTHQNIQQPGEKQQQHVSHFRFLLLIA